MPSYFFRGTHVKEYSFYIEGLVAPVLSPLHQKTISPPVTLMQLAIGHPLAVL